MKVRRYEIRLPSGTTIHFAVPADFADERLAIKGLDPEAAGDLEVSAYGDLLYEQFEHPVVSLDPGDLEVDPLADDAAHPEEAGGEGVPRYIVEAGDAPTDTIIGAALEDGREEGDSRVRLQKRVERYLEAADRLRGAPEGAGDRNPAPHYDFRRDNDYRISAASNGVKVRAWYYEVPHTDEYAHGTKVDPREVKPVGNVAQMIHLGLARVHAQMDDCTCTDGAAE